jgi:hypothetical protein
MAGGTQIPDQLLTTAQVGERLGFSQLSVGISLRDVARYVGTSVVQISKTYGHLAEGAEAAALAKLDAAAEGLGAQSNGRHPAHQRSGSTDASMLSRASGLAGGARGRSGGRVRV